MVFMWHCFVFKQPTEKPTVGKTSAAKDPTDPPSKTEELKDLKTVVEKDGVSAHKVEDPSVKGNCWYTEILLWIKP